MKLRSRLGASAATIAMVVTGSAFAQETTAPTTVVTAQAVPAASDERAVNIGDIIVTASKRDQNLSDVPMSVTAVSGEELLSKGVNNVQDLVRITPGLSYVESGNSVPVFSLRGIGFFDTALGARPTVSVYVDEAPVPFSIMSAGSAFDLQRVEVLKGPQGTLFGSNATGGAINYIAAKPSDTFGGGVTADYGRFNTLDLQGHVTGPISDTLNGRVAVRTVRGDGWQESYTRDDTIGEQNFIQGRVLLDWQPTDQLNVSLNLNGFQDRGDTQAGQLIALYYVGPARAGNVPLLGAYPKAPQNSRAADWDEGRDFTKNNTFYQASLRADYDLSSAVTFTSLTSYSHMDVDQLTDIDGTALAHTSTGVQGELSSLSQEFRLSGVTDLMTWIVGASISREESLENDYLSFPYSTGASGFGLAYSYSETNPYAKQTFNTRAVFANIEYSLNDMWTVHGGLRYTQADLDYEACTKINSVSSGQGITSLFNTLRGNAGLAPIPALLPGECQTLDANLMPGMRTGSFDQSNVAWRAGVDFKPFDRTLVYANVSRGFKAGSVPVLGAINQLQFDPVSQESVDAYEIGFKSSLFDRKVDVSGAAFFYDYSDKQLLGRRIVEPNVLGAQQTLVNVPKSEIRGAEFQVSVYPIDGLILTAATTYIQSEVIGDFPNVTIVGQSENLNGQAFPYTPEWQTVLDGTYRFPIGGGSLEGLVGASYNYRSETMGGFGTNPDLRIDSYGTLDLRAGVESVNDGWRLQVYARNATDEYYWTNVAKYNDVLRRLAGPPATYGIQLGYKF